jgi:hypothetical protein
MTKTKNGYIDIDIITHRTQMIMNLPNDILLSIAKICVADENALTNVKLAAALAMTSKSLDQLVQYVVQEVDPLKDDEVICNTHKVYEQTKKELQTLCRKNGISHSYSTKRNMRVDIYRVKNRDNNLKLTGRYIQKAKNIKNAGYTQNKRFLEKFLNA